MSEGAARQTGTVTKWLNRRGIGFITPDGQNSEIGADLLVHYSNIKQEPNDGFKSLAEGSKVEYETTEDPKNPSKLIAINVTGVGGGNCDKYVHRRQSRGSYGGGGGYRGGDGGSAPAGSSLFVGNVNERTTWQELKDHFKDTLMDPNVQLPFVDVIKNSNSGRAHGLVRFGNAEDAATAIAKVNGTELQGNKLEVRLDKQS